MSPEGSVRAPHIALIAAAFFSGAAAPATDVEGDDPTARLQAMREWYGSDASRRAPLLEAAGRERDRYAVGENRGRGFGANALTAFSGAFINLGPTRADFAVNGDKYFEVDPRNSLVVLATSDAGLFRSTDGGASWSQVRLSANGGDYFYMWSIAFVGNDTWLATGQAADLAMPPAPGGRGPIGLWRSTDDGLTWTSIAPAIPGGDDVARFAGRGALARARRTRDDHTPARVLLPVQRNE